jgi:UDPglucose 6-dehydrogenase
MRIGVVGSQGVVGSASVFGFRKLGHQVIEHDLKLGTNIKCLVDCHIVYICVPTPMKEDGSCDTSIVEQVVSELAEIKFPYIIAIKSTVPPGTTEKIIEKYRHKRAFHICFCPEFLRERSAISDFVENNKILVVGADSELVYEDIVESHGKYPKISVRVSPTEAEMVKLYHNSINALRIIFANEVYEICQKIGINYTKVKNCVIESTGLPDIYLDCNDHMRGFGGVCLPKDTAALLAFCHEKGIDAKMLETIVNENKKYKTTVFDGMRKS